MREQTMAIARKTTAMDLHIAAQQVRDLNGRLVTAGRRAGTLSLHNYEKLVGNVTSRQQKLADQSRNEAVRAVVALEVDLAKQVANVYTSTASCTRCWLPWERAISFSLARASRPSRSSQTLVGPGVPATSPSRPRDGRCPSRRAWSSSCRLRCAPPAPRPRPRRR
jgi:hypothetical protein